MDYATWDKGRAFEVSFWRNWFATKGLEWPDEYRARLDPARPLQPAVGNRLPRGDHRILDVGAGPLTVLGKHWHGQPCNITAVDPLATEYDQLLKDFKITPLVRTELAHVETLSQTFPESTFDVVHMMNALDHSQDPVLGVYELIRVARPEGYIVLSHATREATRERHSGMHQWDFYLDHEHFMIEGKGVTLDISEALEHDKLGKVVHAYGDDRWHWVIIRKAKLT